MDEVTEKAKADLEWTERVHNLKRQIAEEEATRKKPRQALESASTQNHKVKLASPFLTMPAEGEEKEIRQQKAKSELIMASVQGYKATHFDPSADPSTQPDSWDRFRIASQPIKDDVDQREARRTIAQAIRRRHHRRFRFLDRLRDQIRASEAKPCRGCFRPSRPIEFGQNTPWGRLDKPGEDVQPMPRPLAMARSHNPGYVFRSRTSSIIRAREANAAKLTPTNRRLHNWLVTARNLRKQGHDAFHRHLQE